MIQAIPSIEIVAIRMDKVPYVDQSGVYALEEAIMGLHKLNVKVVFVGLHGQGKDMIERIKLVPSLVEKEYCFETFTDFPSG